MKISSVQIFKGIAIGCLCVLLFAGCATAGGSHARVRGTAAGVANEAGPPPPNAKTLYAMSRVMIAQGKDDQAELTLRRALELSPQLVVAHADLAELLMRQGRIEEAAAQLQEGLTTAPNDPVLRNNAGVCHLFQGEYEQALADFQLAAKIIPYEQRFQANVALALGMLGRYDESRQAYLSVMKAGDAEHNIAVIRALRNDAPVAKTISEESVLSLSEPETGTATPSARKGDMDAAMEVIEAATVASQVATERDGTENESSRQAPEAGSVPAPSAQVHSEPLAGLTP